MGDAEVRKLPRLGEGTGESSCAFNPRIKAPITCTRGPGGDGVSFVSPGPTYGIPGPDVDGLWLEFEILNCDVEGSSIGTHCEKSTWTRNRRKTSKKRLKNSRLFREHGEPPQIACSQLVYCSYIYRKSNAISQGAGNPCPALNLDLKLLTTVINRESF